MEMKPRILMLFRGLPGSGKSTLARQFAKGINVGHFPWERYSVEHYEMDDFFVRAGGWVYDPNLLYAAQRTCLEKAKRAMERDTNFVIVANCFIRLFEMQPYLHMAKGYGYQVQEIIANGNFPNLHKVPDDVIARMRRHFQYRPVTFTLGDPLDDPTNLRPEKDVLQATS